MRGSITASDLGKQYRKHDRGRPSSLKGRMLSGYRAPARASFWGLRHATFSIAPGRSVGIVGTNGAGKSTLLRLLGGVGLPDEGSVRVEGRIGALLDIGAGLTEDLTGRENVFLLGVIAGLLRAEVAECLDAIVDFADLWRFIDEPVRTYSTGMRMRLAFAVAVHTKPDVLLIDEVLAVGDQAFQRKCIERIREMQAGGCTVVLVSHDEGQIRAICQEVIFIREGRLVAQGPLDATIALYNGAQSAAAPEQERDAPVRAAGIRPAGITELRLLDDRGCPANTIASGDGVRIEASVEQSGLALNPVLSIALRDAAGALCFQTNSILGGIVLGVFETLDIKLDIERLDLAPGEYRLSAGLFSGDWQTTFDYRADALSLRVVGPDIEAGPLNPPMRWSIVSEEPQPAGIDSPSAP